MAEARARDQWQHTSFACSLLANCNRDPKRRSTPYRPKDFDPYAKPGGDDLVVPIDVLKAFVTGAK